MTRFDRTARGPFTATPATGIPVIGHRGSGRGISPAGTHENTLPAFLQGITDGATWIETDLQATADGTLLLRHNLNDGDGYFIADHTAADLTATGWPTLDQIHAALPPHVGMDLEVKAGLPDDATLASTLDWVTAHAAERPLLITSFDPTVVLAARSAGLQAGWLTNAYWPLYEHIAAAIHLGATVAAVHATSIIDFEPHGPDLPTVMATAATHGLQVMAWDALPEHLPALLDAGVAAVCVDDIATTTATLTALTHPTAA